jgi:hypothetical protein
MSLNAMNLNAMAAMMSDDAEDFERIWQFTGHSGR